MLWLEGRGKRKRGHSCVICKRHLIPKAQLPPCLGNTAISSVINQTLRPSWKVQCSYLEQVRPDQLTSALEAGWPQGGHEHFHQVSDAPGGSQDISVRPGLG